MSEGKKSFVLFKDSLTVLNELSNEQAGILFKAISNYHNGIETDLDFGLKMAFLPFKNQFIRDSESYEKVVERNTINGSKGGAPKKPSTTQDNPTEPNVTQITQSVISEPKKADSDKDRDTVIENENQIFEDFRKLYPGTKGGYQNEFKNYQKKHKDWKETLEKLMPALQKEIGWRITAPEGGFVPEWKHLTTWLNQRCWEQELRSLEIIKETVRL